MTPTPKNPDAERLARELVELIREARGRAFLVCEKVELLLKAEDLARALEQPAQVPGVVSAYCQINGCKHMEQPAHKAASASEESATKNTTLACDCGCGRSCCAMCGTDLGFIEQPAQEWRAKESAPKNKSLLVYDARSKEYAVGWVYEFTRGTHWMPLPAPPAAPTKENGNG